MNGRNRNRVIFKIKVIVNKTLKRMSKIGNHLKLYYIKLRFKKIMKSRNSMLLIANQINKT